MTKDTVDLGGGLKGLAKGFFEIRKISMFTKSIGSSRLWIKNPRME